MIRQSWGYILVFLIAFAWLSPAIGPAFIAIASAAVVIYCLFQAPVWCCAETRQQTFCRNNAYGIVMGCHLKQHKWQKIKMMGHQSLWGRLMQRILAGVGGRAATFSAIGALISASVATITLATK